MVLLQAVTLGLIALIITPGFLFYFDVTPKIALLLLAASGLLVFAPFRRMSAPPRAWSVLIALAALSLAISSAFAINRPFTYIGTSWRELGLIPQLAMLVFAWFAASAQPRPLLRAISLASAVAALYGIAQYFGIDPFLPSSAYHIGEGIWTIVRPPGTLGYVSYFAAWLTMAAFLSLALAAIETQAAWIASARAGAALCVIAMLLTGTRASMLALVAGALLWLVSGGFRLSRRAPVVLALLALAGAAFYFSPAGWNLRSRARWYVEDPTGGGRPILWRDTLAMSAAHPLNGIGAELFTANFPRFESAALVAARPDFEYESPHNMFLDTLIAQGYPGLLILIAVCAYGLRNALRLPNSYSRWLAAALAAAILNHQFIVFIAPTALLFFVVVALAIPRGPEPAFASRPRFQQFSALLLWPAAVAFAFCAVRLVAADHDLARTSSLIAARNAGAAVESYAQYSRRRLPGPSADMWYSRSMLNLSQQVTDPASKALALAQAIQAARLVHTSDDPASAWYNLALFDSLTGDSQAVERDLRCAIDARRNWYKPHWALAQLLQMQGRPDAARQRMLAASLAGGKHPEIQ